MHQTLYLKYRPQTFSELEGQTYIKKTLQNASRNETISHAYLFAGPRGTGKTSSARILAKAINCLQKKEDGNPCTECEMCREIAEGSLTDLIEIDAASNRGIDEIRALRERISFAPNKAKKKIYIIDEVHMLTKDASNALLKTLEEPPSHVHFILATTELHKILPTIISRCQVFQFGPLTTEEIVERLTFISEKEGKQVDKNALEMVATEAHGGMRDALSLLEKFFGSGEKITKEFVTEILGNAEVTFYEGLFGAIRENNPQNVMEILKTMHAENISPTHIIKGFIEWIRAQMEVEIATHTGATSLLLLFMSTLEMMQKAQEQQKYSSLPALVLELALLRLCTEHFVAQTGSPITTTEKSNLAVEETPKSSSIVKHVIKKEVIEEETKGVENMPRGPIKIGPENEPAQMDTNSLSEGVLPSLRTIKTDWEKICMSLPGTLLRVTFKDHALVKDLQDTTVTLEFKNSFNFDIANKEENKNKILDALRKKYGLPFVIDLQLAGRLVQNGTKDVSREEKVSKKELPDHDLSKIADFFGGSVKES